MKITYIKNKTKCIVFIEEKDFLNFEEVLPLELIGKDIDYFVTPRPLSLEEFILVKKYIYDGAERHGKVIEKNSNREQIVFFENNIAERIRNGRFPAMPKSLYKIGFLHGSSIHYLFSSYSEIYKSEELAKNMRKREASFMFKNH